MNLVLFKSFYLLLYIKRKVNYIHKHELNGLIIESFINMYLSKNCNGFDLSSANGTSLCFPLVDTSVAQLSMLTWFQDDVSGIFFQAYCTAQVFDESS